MSLHLSTRMYSNCSGPGFALHSDIVMPYVINYGSKEQIKRFVPKLTAGTCIAAIAMTEPGAGRSGLKHRCDISMQLTRMWCSFHDLAPFYLFSDLQGVRTYAKRDGSDWILNGNKVLLES